ncbi:sensor histidine kinase [Williamsia sp.]|uniref:sensor histidine kinase n=1 Tax=Williamsia sp. TaxID=1872085 RepID=UPI001A1A0CF2|nr:sensor histidine kinase [Williamsia sp.]MBJ7291112.1 sensor histidine kinase [Williamsia sp.]
MKLRTQVLLLQIVVIAISLAVGFGVLIAGSGDRLRDEYAQRALAIARSVASDQQVRDEVARYASAGGGVSPTGALLSDGPLENQARAVAARTGALFVVIANDRGIRLAHPEIGELGKPLSTDPTRALGGDEDINTDRGTLGESVRAKVPIFARSGAVIGLVSVGISTEKIGGDVRDDLFTTSAIALVALAIGIIGSIALARRWRRLTLGLEPDQLTELVREQQAVLHSIGDGVVAVDAGGVVRVINDRARDLLALTGDIGQRIESIGLTPRVLEVAGDPVEIPRAAAVGDRIVLVSSRRVRQDGRDLGIVVSVVDRTDVEGLTREVASIKAISDALRAQRHESANRIHVVAGLIRQGDAAAALDYLDEVTGTGRYAIEVPGLDNVAEPHLHAFLDAKAAAARESGVVLTLGPQTWVDGELVSPVDVITIVGNLVDNAIDAARTGGREPRVVEVELVMEGADLLVTVADSGDGIAFGKGDGIAVGDPDDVFTEGVTTHADSAVPGGRGMGLALSRQSARGHGGDVVIGDPGSAADGVGGESIGDENPLGGAIMVARIPGVLREGVVR